ncbi:hypothetical protein PGTUg99_030437 [Puccinia graminis f. sp. tritici]|uniref:Uncharacterized protein n=1 Tax=Puccinia graminis f. sp. tritici TaxID=56615 RepID=A0A5B0SKB5_PUCGR|nr:hypothetical protein PGTUg99_030437 [Puccinia graminis f. sp. tritici]
MTRLKVGSNRAAHRAGTVGSLGAGPARSARIQPRAARHKPESPLRWRPELLTGSGRAADFLNAARPDPPEKEQAETGRPAGRPSPPDYHP